MLPRFLRSWLPGFGPAVAPAAAVSARPENPSFEAEHLAALSRTWLEAAGAGELARRVQVRWNARLRSTAGTAMPARALVTLNPLLRSFGWAEVEQTLKHELAHLLAQHRAGRRRLRPHGREWQQACGDLGLLREPRCHQLPLPRRKPQRRLTYRCRACGLVVARVRPMRAGTACLACCRQHTGGRYDPRFRFEKVTSAG